MLMDAQGSIPVNGSTPPRVVITGMGAVTPLALSAGETWEKLLAGQSGIDYISKFDTGDLRVNIGGEVRNFDSRNYMDREDACHLDPYVQYAVAATQEALADAQTQLEPLFQRPE